MIDWEQMYRDGTTPWDKSAPAPPLLNWLDKNPGKISGKILVPGCGTGHDVRTLAARCPDATEIIGLDISETALEAARSFEKSGIEKYEPDDLFTLHETSPQHYDWIWEHTCFCAIDPERRDEYVNAVHKLLVPNGNLLAVFFLNPYDEEHQPGGGPPHGAAEGEIIARFVETGLFKIVDSYVPTATYEGREGCELIMHLQKT